MPAMKAKFRIGVGYDAHRLKKGRKLILGGVHIPHEKGLDGHSDADVLVHAIIDALLGAAGLGDIGSHFPDSDPALKGISSIELLKQVGGMINAEGLEVGNIDATVVAEKPEIAAHSEKMKKNIAAALKSQQSAINIKAKTTEGMGFTGRQQGIEAHATALLAVKTKPKKPKR